MNYLISHISKIASQNTFNNPASYFVWSIIALIIIAIGLIIYWRKKTVNKDNKLLIETFMLILLLCITLISMFVYPYTQALSKYNLDDKISSELLLSNTDIIYASTSHYKQSRAKFWNFGTQKTKYVPHKLSVNANLSYDDNGDQTIGIIKNGQFIAKNTTGRQYIALMNSIYEITDNHKPTYLRITNNLNLNLIAHMRFNHQAYLITVGRDNVMNVNVSRY